ncbi:MAG: nitrile hydratase accessory protein [Paraburkholderia sp.]|jgi:nitrile hydratase accessory protein
MLTCFEEYAASSMLGQPDSPPRLQGKLRFDRPWERQVFGLALSLSKAGYFEWEDFRQNLIQSIAQWEGERCTGQPQWDYYERFLIALEKTVLEAGVLTQMELAALMSTGPSING